jgi:hypothetical protein
LHTKDDEYLFELVIINWVADKQSNGCSMQALLDEGWDGNGMESREGADAGET